MGKAIRAACLVCPMVFTTASLILLGAVMIGQLSNNNKAPYTSLGRNLYFFKADTSHFTADSRTLLDKVEVAGNKLNIDTDLLHPSITDASSKALNDFYLVGLWSYCKGKKIDGVEEITYCSSPKFQFWFNPNDIWGLQNKFLQDVIGDNLQKGLHAYRKVMGWMSWAFVFATILTAAEFVMFVFAFYSRIGSLMIWILWIASSVFAVGAATTATTAYGVLSGIFHTAFESHLINASMGREMLLILWFGVAAGVLSGPLWLLSVCCG